MPMITPNNPSADPKISTISILTNKLPLCESANAHALPVMPTQIPQTKLENPTVRPAVKIA